MIRIIKPGLQQFYLSKSEDAQGLLKVEKAVIQLTFEIQSLPSFFYLNVLTAKFA